MKYNFNIEYNSDHNTNCFLNFIKEGKILLEDFVDEPNLKTHKVAEIIIAQNLGKENEKIIVKYCNWSVDESTSFNIQNIIKDYSETDNKIIKLEIRNFKPTQIWLAGLIINPEVVPHFWHKIADFKVSYKN